MSQYVFNALTIWMGYILYTGHLYTISSFVKYFVVFCAETTESSVSGLKRPPAHEVIPPTKRRDKDKKTTPKGIMHWVRS